MSTIKRSASEPLRIAARISECELRIEVLNRQRLYGIDRQAAAKLAAAVLDRIERQDAALTITFIRDAAMRKLNRDYRGKEKPNDVISFA